MKKIKKRILDLNLPANSFRDDMNVAVEVKGSRRVHSTHARGLKALLEEHAVKRAVIVSLENQPRKPDSLIEILPWQFFLEALWSGELGV